MKIKPNLHPLSKEFLQQENLILDLAKKQSSPVHIVLPQIFEDNLKKLQETIDELGILCKVFIAHMANKSPSLLQHAKNLGFGVDVSTLGELSHALSLGFKGEDIECTGPKSRSFMDKAVEEGCLISIDSIQELKFISSLNKKASLLIRLSNVPCYGRDMMPRNSRYGINKDQLHDALSLIKENNQLKFRGFHFHSNGYDLSMRSGLIYSLLDLVEETIKLGFRPSIINIGGAFTPKRLEDESEWQDYIKNLKKNILEGKETKIWGNSNYQIKRTPLGKLNDTKAVALGKGENLTTQLKSILSDQSKFKIPLSDVLLDLLLTLVIEPGQSIFYNSGLTIMNVIGTKKTSNNSNATILEGNTLQLSTKMIEPITDPILISKKGGSSYSTFLFGSLYRSGDIFMQRPTTFHKEPENGDVVVFTNTGSYNMHYASATPQMHEKPKYYVARKNEGGNWVLEEEKIWQ